MNVFYRSAGSGAPIIFIHGFPTSSYDWRALLQPLSKFGRVIAPDLYGFGYSDAPDEIDLTKFLPEFVSAMSIERFTLGGYDSGGSLALKFAIEEPGKVSRLIVMNTTTYPDWVNHARKSSAYAPIRRMMISSISRRITLTFLLNRRRLQQLLAPTSEVIIPKNALEHQSFFIKQGIRNLYKMRPVPYTEPFFKETEEKLRQLAENVQELHVPTLIIFGKDDPYFPQGTPEHLQRDIAGSRLHLLEKTGHFLMEERSNQVIDLVTTFLSETP